MEAFKTLNILGLVGQHDPSRHKCLEADCNYSKLLSVCSPLMDPH